MIHIEKHQILWQQLKAEWATAMEQGKRVTVHIQVLFLPDNMQQPVGLDVHYVIDGQSFVRTFRGIPEGYDAAIRRPE